MPQDLTGTQKMCIEKGMCPGWLGLLIDAVSKSRLSTGPRPRPGRRKMSARKKVAPPPRRGGSSKRLQAASTPRITGGVHPEHAGVDRGTPRIDKLWRRRHKEGDLYKGGEGRADHAPKGVDDRQKMSAEDDGGPHQLGQPDVEHV